MKTNIPKANKVEIIGHVTIRHYDYCIVQTYQCQSTLLDLEGTPILKSKTFMSVKEALNSFDNVLAQIKD